MGGVIIGADFVPTGSNYDMFIDGDAVSLFGSDMLRIIKEADYRIFNLESPLTDVNDPILKHGPCLSAPEECVNGYRSIDVNMLVLANNHIMDQGIKGFCDTINVLDKNGISRVGAGENAIDAAKPILFEMSGSKIGVYACAEHEFSVASASCPGANPFDPLETPDHIAELRERCDHVIVLYHGGAELYRYPSPELQKRCRKMIQKGADIVICQHSHCIGCEEKYLNGTIVYGQGNFLFDRSDKEEWETGLLIRIDERFTVSYIPISKTGNTVRLADEKTAETIMEQFRMRSTKITEQGFVENEYDKLAMRMLPWYLSALNGKKSIVMRIMDRLSGRAVYSRWIKKKYGKKQNIRIQNYVECEAHRELLIRGLKNRQADPGRK